MDNVDISPLNRFFFLLSLLKRMKGKIVKLELKENENGCHR